MKSRISIFAVLAVVVMLGTMVACGGGGGGSESVNYSGVSIPAVLDTTVAVPMAGDLTLSAIDSEGLGSMAFFVFSAFSGLQSSSLGLPASALSLSAEPLAYSCENGSFIGSISGSVSARACGDFDQGELDYLEAAFTNFSMIAGQVFEGEMLVDVGTSEVDIVFRDFSLVDSSEGYDMFIDGIMSASEAGSVSSLYYNIFVEDRSPGGVGIWLNDLTMTVEDFTTYSTFTINGRIYDSIEGFVDVQTIAPLEIDAGSDYPRAGEVKYTGANGAYFRIVVQTGGYVVYVDPDGDGPEGEWTSPLQLWS